LTILIDVPDYNNVINANFRIDGTSVNVIDHLGGFDSNLNNRLLSSLTTNYNIDSITWEDSVISSELKEIYPVLQTSQNICRFFNVFNNPDLTISRTFKNFICSFNGSEHVSRQFLVAALQNFGYYDKNTCSKLFKYSNDTIVGNLRYYTSNKAYINYFFNAESNFNNETNHFNYKKLVHSDNILNLESILLSSFVHVVSETQATSHYPFVTEKFLYSVITKGLFVTYGPELWHKHVNQYLGFKKYDKIFDYAFDDEPNPVFRLIMLLTMLSKFQNLSEINRHNLYEIERETIEFNYDHFRSGDYKRSIFSNGY